MLCLLLLGQLFSCSFEGDAPTGYALSDRAYAATTWYWKSQCFLLGTVPWLLGAGDWFLYGKRRATVTDIQLQVHHLLGMRNAL